jgi:hypothetical protein
VDALTTSGGRPFTDDDRALIAELLSPDTTYAGLDQAYRTFFEGHRGSSAAAARSLPEAGLPTPAVAHAD